MDFAEHVARIRIVRVRGMRRDMVGGSPLPFAVETSWLDDGPLYVPLGVHLFQEGFCESFQCWRNISK